MPEGFDVSNKNALYNEHLNLKEGVKPIIVSLGTVENFGEDPHSIKIDNFVKENVHEVNWFKNKNGSVAEKKKYYAISDLDNSSKFSEKFSSCTGLVVAGIDKETGENISFVTHQAPTDSLIKGKDDFIDDLAYMLAEVKKRCKQGTIDALIVCGKIGDGKFGDVFMQRYIDSIRLLGREVKETLGFEPVVVNGPKKDGASEIAQANVPAVDYFVYDTPNRRGYMIRPKVNSNISAFLPSDIDEERNKWE